MGNSMLCRHLNDSTKCEQCDVEANEAINQGFKGPPPSDGQVDLLVNCSPSDDQIFNACMYRRHDFGLMKKEDQERMVFSAKEWLRAWSKVLGYS